MASRPVGIFDRDTAGEEQCVCDTCCDNPIKEMPETIYIRLETPAATDSPDIYMPMYRVYPRNTDCVCGVAMNQVKDSY